VYPDLDHVFPPSPLMETPDMRYNPLVALLIC
jgi:hypothetical protein